MNEIIKSIEAVKEARAQGDLSENFEYYAAKRDKNKNESRIRYLERMIKTAEIISEDSVEDEVGLNNTVELYFEEESPLQSLQEAPGNAWPSRQGCTGG